jgi:HlyD family secretion protein
MQPSSTTAVVATAPVRRRSFFAPRIRWAPWLSAALALIVAAGAWRYVVTRPPPPAQYKTMPVGRHTIVGRVTASGTLSAIVTVQVGTQVSGRIQRLNADFNSRVQKGQLVAKIDPQLFQAAADQAEANYVSAEAAIAKAQAEARIADRQQARAKALHDESLASQSDLDNALAAAESAHASLDVARAALAQTRAARNQAQVNLSYTNIVSPIDGVVISRNVDVGQTVAASLQAPTIFTIAQDLTKMQVDTNVAEADVGRLQVDMPTYFTVDSFPGQRFRGKIREIRNAATMLQNVVTYDAVIDVDNSDLRLRPGMTANVTIVYAERPSALAVPNAALRFHPSPALANRGAAAPSKRGAQASTAAADEKAEARRIWVMRGLSPEPVAARIGLTDGTMTEVLDGDLRENDEVVIEAVEPGSTPSGTSSALRRLF